MMGMKRRGNVTRVAICVAIAVAGLTLSGTQEAPAAEEDPRPNVLVIVTDDQRWSAMAHMRATKQIFKRGGTNFTNAFVTTPYCCPSRASIMTGKYAHNHGVRSGEELDQFPAVEEASIQKALKGAGYRTAMFGKFLNAWPVEQDPQYLDRWAHIPHADPDGYYNGTWNVNGTVRRVRRYSTTFLRRLALDFIEDNERSDGEPWFVYIAPSAPHFPYDTQPRYTGHRVSKWKGNPAVREEDRTDKPVWVQTRNQGLKKGQKIRRQQLRTLMSVDDMVAKLFQQLEELGETDTLAIFTSDNGYIWGEHGVTQKRFPYLPSVHVPYMVRWPGHVAANVREHRIVSNIDIAPSIAEATGTSFSGYDGKSLFSGVERDRLLLEWWRQSDATGDLQNWASTLTPDYQYTEYYDASDLMIFQEHYDLVNDPWQLLNTLGDPDPLNNPMPLEMQELTTQLNQDRSCVGTEECP